MKALQRVGTPVVVVELDHRVVERLKVAGTPVVYGDGSHDLVLEASEVPRARLLVATSPDMVVTRAIVERARRSNPGLDVVARTSDSAFLPELHRMGVTDVVVPEFEAGVEMVRQILLHLRIPIPEIQRHTERVCVVSLSPSS